jgi:arginine:ornithine antiporter/lysine permease
MTDKKLGLFLMTALAVSSMIGGGIFNSPTDLIANANPMATLIAWGVGGLGVFSLVLVFQDLALRKPELKGGIYSYAREGFGDYVGFFSTWGYWIGGLLGTVSFFPLFFKTLNSLYLENAGLSPVMTFVIGSVALWIITWIIVLGVRDAGIVNAIVTLMKMTPLFLIILLGVFAFKPELFLVPDWTTTLASSGNATTPFEQVRGAMGTILWCFLGVEAAVVLSNRATSQAIVAKATVLGFFITLAVYVAISTLSMGIVDAKGLSGAATPLADVLARTAIGSAGAYVAKIGLMISVTGATLSWILLIVELPYLAARDGLMPKWFAVENSRGVPINSLLINQLLIQICLLSLLSEKLQATYSAIYLLSTSTMLIPYLFSAMYAVKLYFAEGETLGKKSIAILATVYSAFVIYAVGLLFLACTIIIFAVGTIPFHLAKREKNERYVGPERWLAMTLIVAGIAMANLIGSGTIKL